MAFSSEQLPIFNKFEIIKNLLIESGFYNTNSFLSLMENVGEDNNEAKFERLVSDIECRTPDEIEKFGQIVRQSQLIENELSVEDDESATDSNIGDITKHVIIRLKDLMLTPKACGEEILVQKSKKVKSTQYGDVYSMTSRPRGNCIIIDNHKFDVPDLRFRNGSRADAFRLKDVFSQLGFDVYYYPNKTVSEIETILTVLSSDPQLQYHDALAIVILSHGITDAIYGSDGITLPVDFILRLFNNINCPLLRHKPKMFFLSACRGHQIDSGAEYYELESGSAAMPYNKLDTLARLTPNHSIRKVSIPTWSDMFVCFSSVTGYASLRNINTGSWFGYELAYALAKYSHREHLLDLVTTKVGKEIQIRESENDGRRMKQAPETIVKGGVKKLYFNPGC